MSNLVWCGITILILAATTVGVRFYARPVFWLSFWHNLVWAAAMLVIGSPLVHYKTASWGPWLTLITGLVAFNVGAVVIWQLLERRGPQRSRMQERWPLFRQNPDYLTTRPVFWTVAGLYAVGFAFYLINIQTRFGIENLVLQPTIIRKGADGVSYLESLPLPARILLYLGPLVFAMIWYTPALNKPFKPIPRVLLTIVVLLTMIAMLQRSNLFIAILLTCALYITGPLAKQTTSRRSDGFLGSVAKWWDVAPKGVRILGGLMLLGVVGLIAFQSVGISLGKTATVEVKSGAVSSAIAKTGLASPVQYYTVGAVAFLRLVEETEGQPDTYGSSTLALPLKFVPGINHEEAIRGYIDIGVRTNVYTWLEPYYRDFGYVGVLLGSLGYGLLAGWLFVTRHRSTTRLWISAAVFATVFLAPFATRLDSALVFSIILSIGVIGFVTRWQLQRRTPAPVEDRELVESR
ncbi:oligosaccharide repeat unit polymerase [Leifsonia sp. F6_8S_P_1B]|uniref:Oligosaccharide repeat unit polymerase n=1 Tax=Leifsonia williamsii TaxID=3035919 RepID=A0ABT8KG10_9MICO|nr:oligosaccharide repeat unit polymerase [Leifsonia williamsii]MDN4616391.1 oligosaccharide repeat unit polymerase [Leifsonia williamsii]